MDNTIIFFIIGLFVIFFIGIFLYIIIASNVQEPNTDVQNYNIGNTGTTPQPNEPDPDRSMVLMSRTVG